MYCFILVTESAPKSAVSQAPGSTRDSLGLTSPPLDTVTTHYVGTISGKGSTFGSTLVRSVLRVVICPLSESHLTFLALECRGSPFITEVGIGKLIKGWDEGKSRYF